MRQFASCLSKTFLLADMAKQSSRELALERRKALSESGKKSTAISGDGSSRVRSSADARVTRTNTSFARSKNNSSAQSINKIYSSTSSSSAKTVPGRHLKRVSQPGRELVLARREALSRRGKSADTSKDRTRVDIEKISSPKTLETTTKYCCDECEEKDTNTSASQNPQILTKSYSSATGKRRPTTKRRAIQNSSRALVLARREAQSKHGKTAGSQPVSAASVARQGDPDLTSREIALRVRELRSKSGSTGQKRSGGTRPCGPNKNGSKQIAADANWKVGVSETSSGQVVTGTQANRSSKTTGNEASTCRSITGTQYLGSEVFDTFCQSALPPSQPSKVAVTNTTHGNLVTGNEVGRSDKVTGDEPGTCKNLTGTEYISANQSNAYCGSANQSPRKVGQSLTLEGRKVSGVLVGRSSNVTGDEAGSNKELTGDQYLGSDPLPGGRPAEKVGSFNTLRGSDITGTNVGRSASVTGNEPGSCKRVTGDEYVGYQQYDSFCDGKPAPEAAKVGLSLTNKSKSVSGTLTGRSSLVTGDEPGTCKAVTGTPYAGLDQASNWCSSSSIEEIQQRTPRKLGTPGSRLTGQQPGIGGVMTGAERGACEPLTGTPYVGSDQLVSSCGANAPAGSHDQEKSLDSSAWTQFSVQSPARSAHITRELNSSVTGTNYENSAKITGPFDMAPEKVTGTEQFRFDRKPNKLVSTPKAENNISDDSSSRPTSRITGEGQSSGLNITGDDWERGDRVTGTEGVSARRRNPTQPGSMKAMPSSSQKRNEEITEPDFLITGSSGNTREGQLVTFSGGARG